MKRLICRAILSTLLVMLLAVGAAADTYDKHTLAAVTVSGPSQVAELQACRVDIVGRRGDVYKVLFTPEQLDAFTARGFSIEVLDREMAEDRRLWAEADAAARAAESAGRVPLGRAPTFYYTASTFNTNDPGSTTLMRHLLDLHTAYPAITRLYDIGNSCDSTACSAPYDIIAIKVTRNPDVLEAEPKIRVYGNIHGDEKGGLMVACEALDWILTNYATDANARRLVDESEMWFIPMGNPYGNANNTRYNYRSVDLNRNFDGPVGHDDGASAFSEPETQAIRDLTEVTGKRFATGLSFHGGAACFNSLWNYDYLRPEDEPIFWSARTPGSGCGEEDGCLVLEPTGLAQAYKDGCTTPGFWFTNGADWYTTVGDTNDWSYHVWSTLDTTLEATEVKTPSASTIPTYVAEHRPGVINYLLKTFQGIHGVMTDGDTGAPLDGTVEMQATSPAPHTYRTVFTDPAAGDFHHTLIPGTYTVTCKAPGYTDRVVTGVVVSADAATTCNCPMYGLAGLHAATWSLADVCPGAGSGGDLVLDPGEDATVAVTLANAGGRSATNVTGSLSAAVAGVTVLDGTAFFADIPGSGTGSSLSPHFSIRVAPTVACGTEISLQLHLTSDQGSWDDVVALTVGSVAVGGGTLIDQSFTTGNPPAGWTVVNGGTGTQGWTTANPGNRQTPGGMTAPFEIIDGDKDGSSKTQDDSLVSPVFDCTGATKVTLTFDTFFNWYSSADTGYVDVSSNGGSTWQNRVTWTADVGSVAAASHQDLDITALAAGSAQARVRFRYVGNNGWYWIVDNVRVSVAAPGACTATTCVPLALPKPVPDGKWVAGEAMRATRRSGNTVGLTWDVDPCAASGYSLYSGPLSAVASYGYDTWSCSLSSTGSADATVSATGTAQFFVVVPREGSVEGSHGRNSTGNERPASGVGHCTSTTKEATGTCP